MTGSAQREVAADGVVAAEAFALEPMAAGRAELRQQVAERLAAHRRRRGQELAAGQTAEEAAHKPRRRQHAVAAAVSATVAERYAQTPSYRAFLAEQARQAVEEAAATAEVARRNAEAVAAVQQELLGELALWDAPQEFTRETAQTVETEERLDAPAPGNTGKDSAVVQRVAGLTVRLYEDLGRPPSTPRVGRAAEAVDGPDAAPDEQEAQALDAEIAFRQSPVFEDYKAFLAQDREPPVPLPANLLEFPRQLIAARRARPRLAEGPLADEAPRTRQLRIFEVEPEQISTAPPVPTAAPEWAASIRLEAHAPAAPVATAEAPLAPALLPPQTAPLGLRLMAALVDLLLVLLALVGFVAVFAEVVGQVPTGLPAALALAATGAAMYLGYELLFFSLRGDTPGMRYARIGLCTFADENPTRAEMRRRILAQLVAVCPMGLGLLWALLDDDGLGWHDRMSRMYQRAY